MKREREFLDASPIFWNGNIISVFKIVAYYGFDNMQDISMFSTISKYFYDWMNENVIARGILILDIHEIVVSHYKTVLNYPFPKLSLLKNYKMIDLVVHKCNTRNFKSCLLTCIVNGNIILQSSYGKNIFKTFKNNKNLMCSHIKVKNNQIIIYVSKA